jgi:hypothetical protein
VAKHGSIFDEGYQKRSQLDRPMDVEPQFPFMMMRATFTPDVGWNLKPGDFIIGYSITHTNIFGMSNNSSRYKYRDGDPAEFGKKGSGYSIYIDGDLFWHKTRFSIGILDSLEFQYIRRELKFSGAGLDNTIETFHKTFGLPNQGRENINQDEFNVYIWDNANQKMVFQFTDPENRYKEQSTTLGLKLSLYNKDDFSSSVRLSYNNKQSKFKTLDDPHKKNSISTINELDKSYNLSFNASSDHEYFSWHMALASTFMNKPVFDRGPDNILYYFLGINLYALDWVHLVLQDMQHTSLFPKDENSAIGDDANELTMGFRVFLSNETTFEFAAVENLTQAPNNIDIAFYSTLIMVF